MELTLDQALQKGIEAHKAGDVQQADKYYTAILKANPKHSDANHNMGVLAVGVGKVETALPFFKTALEANPRIAQYWLSYIGALIKLDRIPDAKTVVDQAKGSGLESKSLDQIEKKLCSIISKTSKTDEPSQEKLQSLINLYTQGQYQEALNKGSRLLEQFPNSINLYNIVGTASKQLGELEDAIEAYQKALSINPDFADIYYNMGNALEDQGKIEEAIEAYQKALSIKPDYAEAFYNMGNALKNQGKLDEAVEAYNKALSLNPDFSEAHYNKGNALKDLDKLEEAIQAYNKTLSLNPNFSEAYYNIGSALKELGKLEEAIEVFEKSNDQKSVAQVLECNYLLGNIDDFNMCLNSIAKRDPTNIRVAAISAFAANQREGEDSYPFCTNPLDLIKFSHIRNHISDSDNFIFEILNEMNKKNSVWEPRNKTTKGGFQTNNRLFSNPSPNMKILEDIFKEELNLFKTELNNSESIIFKRWPDEIKINAWYVRMLQNGHQDSHIHPGGWVSGVFYLKTVQYPIQNEGAIEFGLHGYNYPVTNANYPRRLYQPLDGDLVLFPSSLFHRTLPVIKDVERCVIAFDLVP